MSTSSSLERHQAWVCLLAVAAGLLLGALHPPAMAGLEVLLWPVLAALLYVTFLQVPLWHLRDALADTRFLCAMLTGQFLLLPAAVWWLLGWLPEDPALRLGVALVLLAPCTDWFISFSQLGGGSPARAVAVTPVNLLLQALLLPVWLWLLLPSELLDDALRTEDLLPAALGLLGAPLLAAALSERWLEAHSPRAVWRERLAALTVPLLALVVFLVAGTQVGAVLAAGPALARLLPVFLGFMLVAVLLARLLASALALPVEAGRTLAFGLLTRNSFVVLPLALALPAGWETVAVVIVLQSLVELAGLVFMLWWVPEWLFRRR